ncbi:MAG: hypothetical protein ACXWQR_14005, partial [Ktedonobacterales bacterium]
IHAQAMNVVGVWEEQHDPLLLHARLIHIDGERKFFPEAEPWAYPNLERSPDPHWPSIPASQLQCDVGRFEGTLTELAAFVSFLSQWAGDSPLTPTESVAHFIPIPLPAWRLLEMDEPEDVVGVHDNVPGEYDIPFEPEALPTEQDEAPRLDDLPPSVSEWLEASPGDWDKDYSAEEERSGDLLVASLDDGAEWEADTGHDDQLYFGKPAYRYMPDSDVLAASELYTQVIMPTWEAHKNAPWYYINQPMQSAQASVTINVDAVEIVTFRLTDLHDPDFEPYIDLGIGYIVFNRAALRDYIALLKHHIEQRQRTR